MRTKVMWRTLLAGALALGTALPAAAQRAPQPQTAVFAGGCFWGVQAVFAHVKGVIRVTSGYAGGAAATAQYYTVGTGTTGHAESVEIVFDPAQVSYATLLRVFFTVAHDPTQLNRQGPDYGTQYRSAVFTLSAQQRAIADSVIAGFNASRAFGGPIVTVVSALDRFYPAEAYHQDYAFRHPMDPYIMINDRPKVTHLRERFPELYRDEPSRVATSG